MCGIIGIIASKEGELVRDAAHSLKDLEYRGYDSAGIGFVYNGKYRSYKAVGAPSEVLTPELVYKSTRLKEPLLHSVIAHNRWATHGKPSYENAHPHTNCDDSVAVVHNGTLLNFAELRASLTKAGHTFKSETDTEVIAHLLEETGKHEKSFEDAFIRTVKMLEGSFGLIALNTKEPEKLYVAKNGSPIYIGTTGETFIISSSVNALVRYTDSYIALGDRELAVLSVSDSILKQNVYQFKSELTQTVKKVKTIEGIAEEDLTKGEFDTFMLKEIYEQPTTASTTMLGRYSKKTGDAVLGGIMDYDNFLSRIRSMYTVSCGTAHHASIVGKYIIEEMTNIFVSPEIASEFKYRDHNLDPRETALFAVSQSGETADTLEAVREAKRKKFTTFGIVNVVGSTLSEETDAGEYTRAGSEIGVASTKAFTSQLTLFYLLALKLARSRGFKQQDGKQFINGLERIAKQMEQVLHDAKIIEKLAKKYKNVKNISFLGRGVHSAIASEAALKFKELTYFEAGSYPLGELKHGPIAIIDKNHLSVVIMPHDALYEISKNSVEQILSKGGRVLIITDKSRKRDPLFKYVDDVIYIPTLKTSILYPLLEILPLQLFAYYFATAHKRNVDKPRNLAKSVTVE